MSDLILVSFVPGINANTLLKSQQITATKDDGNPSQEKLTRRKVRIVDKSIADDSALSEADPFESEIDREN
jgi:hypothetical protein